MTADQRFEESAAAVYRVPPTGFIAARDEQVRVARAAGDAELAKRLQALRKPTQSAWLVNLLCREHRDDVERLLDLGAEFEKSQTGETMRQLFARRQQMLGELGRAAQRQASGAGVRVAADTALEVEETLGAALADPDAAEQVRSGRLVKPLSYAGFGPPIPPPTAKAPTKAKTEGPAKSRADKAVAAAQKAADAAEVKARATEKELDDLTQRRDQIREQVRDAQRRLAEAELNVRSATGELKRANQAATEARRKLDKAERDRAALVDETGYAQLAAEADDEDRSYRTSMRTRRRSTKD